LRRRIKTPITWSHTPNRMQTPKIKAYTVLHPRYKNVHIRCCESLIINTTIIVTEKRYAILRNWNIRCCPWHQCTLKGQERSNKTRNALSFAEGTGFGMTEKLLLRYKTWNLVTIKIFVAAYSENILANIFILRIGSENGHVTKLSFQILTKHRLDTYGIVKNHQQIHKILNSRKALTLKHKMDY
jgi:hypothetical protein